MLANIGIFSSNKASSGELSVLGAIGWYKSDIGVTESGGSISAWADQSGNGNDFISINNPTLVTGSINGYPAISFDGIADVMLATGLQPSTATYFLVTRIDSITNYGMFISTKGLYYTELRLMSITGKIEGITRAGEGIADNNFDTGPLYNVITFKTGEGAQAIYTNGGIDGTSSSSASLAATSGLSIGARLDGSNVSSFFANISIAELIVYPTALNDTDRQSVEDYLASKYNI